LNRDDEQGNTMTTYNQEFYALGKEIERTFDWLTNRRGLTYPLPPDIWDEIESDCRTLYGDLSDEQWKELSSAFLR